MSSTTQPTPSPSVRAGDNPVSRLQGAASTAHLPVREQYIDLPEAEQVCRSCGQPLNACGSEDSEQLEIEIIVFRREIHRRRGQRICDCPGPRTCAAPPAKSASLSEGVLKMLLRSRLRNVTGGLLALSLVFAAFANTAARLTTPAAAAPHPSAPPNFATDAGSSEDSAIVTYNNALAKFDFAKGASLKRHKILMEEIGSDGPAQPAARRP